MDKTVSIPNKEVSQEYVNSISTMDWHEVIDSVEASKNLLEALWMQDEEAVAAGIDKAHREISILQYNNENSLACTINLAFYFAREYYTIIREFPTGKGFADLCFIPRKMHADKPAVVIELKWEKSAQWHLLTRQNSSGYKFLMPHMFRSDSSNYHTDRLTLHRPLISGCTWNRFWGFLRPLRQVHSHHTTPALLQNCACMLRTMRALPLR